jgi:chemosensory pili system protein ChpE
MGELFWSIAGLALALCAAPGPINIEMVRQGVNHGFMPALGVHIGAVAAELAWAGVVLLGLAPFIQQPAVQSAMAMVGACVLLWMAWQTMRAALVPAMAQASTRQARHGVWTGAIYAASHPLVVTFWISIAAMLTVSGITPIQPLHLVVIVCAYIAGGMTWGVAVAALAAWSRKIVQPRMWRWLNAVSGVLLATYGFQLLWTFVR